MVGRLHVLGDGDGVVGVGRVDKLDGEVGRVGADALAVRAVWKDRSRITHVPLDKVGAVGGPAGLVGRAGDLQGRGGQGEREGEDRVLGDHVAGVDVLVGWVSDGRLQGGLSEALEDHSGVRTMESVERTALI